jgi:excisionase family DNA binding protein
MTDKLNYRPDELAEALAVSVDFIYRLMISGDIAYIWVGKRKRIPRTVFVRLVRDGITKRNGHNPATTVGNSRQQ